MLRVKSRVARVGESNGALLYLPAYLLTEFLSPIHPDDLPCEVTVEVDGDAFVVRKIKQEEVETLE